MKRKSLTFNVCFVEYKLYEEEIPEFDLSMFVSTKVLIESTAHNSLYFQCLFLRDLKTGKVLMITLFSFQCLFQFWAPPKFVVQNMRKTVSFQCLFHGNHCGVLLYCIVYVLFQCLFLCR
ncbi:MAG: hypothetical protein DRJ40_06250 [Thermoprotei archaeon]|nr:MAG: hypothetical protein DRJ40_06250 [Thermoprotei archaeon]